MAPARNIRYQGTLAELMIDEEVRAAYLMV